MGLCASCFGRRKGHEDEFSRLSGASPHGGGPVTEQDRAARALAAERAEARQRQFEQSAVGRAALKAVKDAKRQDARPANNTTAQDWLS